MQEALVTGLIGLVHMQRLDSSSVERYDLHSTDISSTPIFQAIKKQVEILRKEMLDSRKSVEDANKNNVLKHPRSGSASAAGFGLGRRWQDNSRLVDGAWRCKEDTPLIVLLFHFLLDDCYY